MGLLLFTTASRPAMGPTKFSIQGILEAPSAGIKQPGREDDHSPKSSTEFKNV